MIQVGHHSALGVIEIRQRVECRKLAALSALAVTHMQHGQAMVLVSQGGGDAAIHPSTRQNAMCLRVPDEFMNLHAHAHLKAVAQNPFGKVARVKPAENR